MTLMTSGNYIWNYFSQHIKNIHYKTKVIMEEECNGDLASIDNLLRGNNSITI